MPRRLDEIELLEREAERAGRLCMPCHNYVYDPALIRGRELAREGKFGRLASFWLIYNQAHDASAMAPGITLRRLCIHHAYAVLFFPRPSFHGGRGLRQLPLSRLQGR